MRACANFMQSKTAAVKRHVYSVGLELVQRKAFIEALCG